LAALKEKISTWTIAFLRKIQIASGHWRENWSMKNPT